MAYAGYATSEKGLVDQVMDGHSRRFGVWYIVGIERLGEWVLGRETKPFFFAF